MSKQTIHLLPPHEAEKIAAGEVVERPATIVKELVENSLDAGSTEIRVSIEKAGKHKISIQDNGLGMSEKDSELCFTRHATSKISSVDELVSIHSFGFRGEALASIGAVSTVTLLTKQADEKIGRKVIYKNGVLESNTNAPTQTGTQITITGLFDQIPVRKKFLKQDETEFNQIHAIMQAFILTHPTVSFKLTKDNKEVLFAPGLSKDNPESFLVSRIGQIWGHNLSAQMISLPDYEHQNIKISGAISSPQLTRYGRHQIFFFVNKRLVKNSDLSKALLKGYKNILPPGKFPAGFVFLDITGSDVDINIHPRKEEVRFTHPGRVTKLIQTEVTKRLESYISESLGQASQIIQKTKNMAAQKLEQNPFDYQPAFQTHYQEPPVIKTLPQNTVSLNSLVNPDKIEHKAPETSHDKSGEISNIGSKLLEQAPAQEQVKEHTEQKQDIQDQVYTEIEKPRIIGQLYKTYILLEHNGEFIIVDQHAAHERILYHQFTHKFENKEGTRLLFPEIIELSESDITTILKYRPFFENQGISFDQGGPSSIAVTTAPPKIQKESLKELILESLAFIYENSELDQELLRKSLNEHVHSHMACKAAIRAGDVLDVEEMEALLTQLLETPNRFICVHGRPTMWKLSQKELEKKFQRV